MKNVIITTTLFLLCFGAANAQYIQQDNASTKRQFRGMIEALQGFRLPVQGGHSIPAGDSLWFVRVNPGDGNIYMWDGLTWSCMTCGGTGIVDSNLFVTITRLIDSLSRVQQTLDDSTAALRLLIASGAADSAFFATLYRLDTTRAGLDMRIALKQNQLNGTGFVKVSGTTISYDNSTYTPTGRTITINGIAQDLSANRSWTIPVPDTSNLRADIDANSDSILDHRTAINGKEPIIAPGTTADYWRGDKTWQAFPFVPDSTDYWTRNDADTSLQNIRDEINNLPAPPVTSVNGQTGNVVLQFMDTAYVSGDTIYAEKGGNTFVVGVMTGGGSLDTAAVSAIVADSLSGVIRQGGNSFGDTVKIGSNDNFPLNFRINNSTRFRATNWVANYGLLHPSQNTGIVFANNSLRFPSSGDFIFYPGGSGSTNVMRYTASGLAIGYGDVTNASAKLDVNGSALINGGTLEVKGNSASVGYAMDVKNSAGNTGLRVNNDLTVNIGGQFGTGSQFNNNGRLVLGGQLSTIFQLDVRQNHPGNYVSSFTNTNASGYSGFRFANFGFTYAGAVGYGNVSAAFWANQVFLKSDGNRTVALAPNNTNALEAVGTGEILIKKIPSAIGKDSTLVPIGDTVGKMHRHWIVASGSTTFSGDASETTFTVSHLLPYTPTVVVATPTSADAASPYYITNKTTTTFDIVFITAPSAGTDNITFDWMANP